MCIRDSPKMFIPFIVVLPGMVAAVLVNEMVEYKGMAYSMGAEAATDAFDGLKYNDAILLLMRDVLPNGLLGLVLAGLLASFTTGMAANISSFNAVFTYDIWQRYVKKDKDDTYYLKAGRIVTVVATIIAIGTSLLAARFSNLMDYLQTPVSYTHLRAHETKANLVCRLLLEKKKKQII